MTGYLISVIGIVCLGVLVDIVMPTGQMNKYVKSMFGIFTIIVLISPVIKIIKSDYDISNLFYNQISVQIDKDFLEATNKKIIEEVEISIEKNCENKGFYNVECEIESILENNVLTIKKVTLNLKKMVISSGQVHINKYTELEQAVMQVVNIKGGQVVFDEWWKKAKGII